MKNLIQIITKMTEKIYGWGIFVCLFLGGMMFFGYLLAFVLGGEWAIKICDLIYNKIFKILIYGGNVIVLMGLANMYLKRINRA